MPKIAPSPPDSSSSIYKPKVPDSTNCVLASWGVSADPLPTWGIANPFCHQQVQVIMAWSVETDDTFPFAAKVKAFWLLHLYLWLLLPWLLPQLQPRL